MNVRFKKTHPNAITPVKANPQDAGFDLFAAARRVGFSEDRKDSVIAAFERPKFVEYDTGIAVEIPEGFVGLVFPRSSVSNIDLTLANSVGVIDSTYRGSIKVRFRGIPNMSSVYDVGNRVAQMIIIPFPEVTLEETEELSTTVRGEGGFGSSGN